VKRPPDAKWKNISGLSIEYGIYDYDEYDSFYGLWPRQIGDDETINQAKDRIIEVFEKEGITISRKEIRWFIDGGYKG
jgi:hypothetical protein